MFVLMSICVTIHIYVPIYMCVYAIMVYLFISCIVNYLGDDQVS